MNKYTVITLGDSNTQMIADHVYAESRCAAFLVVSLCRDDVELVACIDGHVEVHGAGMADGLISSLDHIGNAEGNPEMLDVMRGLVRDAGFEINKNDSDGYYWNPIGDDFDSESEALDDCITSNQLAFKLANDDGSFGFKGE